MYYTVQTPLIDTLNACTDMSIGSPIFFRPAKSGELAERFTHYYVLINDDINNNNKSDCNKNKSNKNRSSSSSSSKESNDSNDNSSGTHVRRVKTYRGLGQAFY